MLLRYSKQKFGYVPGLQLYVVFVIIAFILLFDITVAITKSILWGIVCTIIAIILFNIRERIFFKLSYYVRNIYATIIKVKIKTRQYYYYNKIINDYDNLLTNKADLSNIDYKAVKKFDRLLFSYICYGDYKLDDISKIYFSYLKHSESDNYGRAILYARLQKDKHKISNYDDIVQKIAVEIFRKNNLDIFISDVSMYLSYSSNGQVNREIIKNNFLNDLPPEYQLGVIL